MTSAGRNQKGFTLVEILIVMSLLTIVLGMGYGAIRDFGASSIVDRAATMISGDVKRTRAYAIQQRRNVALVADEAARSYEIRHQSEVLGRATFSASTDNPLTLLDVMLPGDSLTFNSRGLMIEGGAVIEVAREGVQRQVTASTLGRTRVTSP